MKIVTRSEWGGPASIGAYYGAPMTAVTAHHTYSPALPASASSKTCRDATLGMHRDHIKRNKWAGLGYGFVIYQNGEIHEGRGWNRVGSHAGSAAGNRTLGVAFVINGKTTAPSDAALKAFAELRDEGVRLGKLTRGHALKLHSDWKATDCPGKVLAAALAAAPAPTHRVAGQVLQPGDTGEFVRAYQRVLVLGGYMTQAEMDTGPGIFGPRTTRASNTFIAAHT